MRRSLTLLLLVSVAACGRFDEVGKAPAFTPAQNSLEHQAMMSPALPEAVPPRREVDQASLWSGSKQSLLGDNRASERGDILTVVIDIDESATINNSTERDRSGSESFGVGSVFGLEGRLPADISLDPGVELNSSSESSGSGSVRRNEELELRVAATVVDVLQNGVLQIEGTQEVRVNFEMRQLTVTGYVRPQDISRGNEITYDKIASARINYGGRGQITDMQQPRYGQQVADKILPF